MWLGEVILISRLEVRALVQYADDSGDRTLQGEILGGEARETMPPVKGLAAIAVSLVCANTATASIITLSQLSSDDTDPALLSATFDFAVSGNTLTLSVTNDTLAPIDYLISEVYFNAPDGVTLSFDGLAGWSFLTGQTADGFGRHDFALIDGQGNELDQIESGETVIFSFTILTGSLTPQSILSSFSEIPPGNQSMVIAAKFQSGPMDDSAFGASIPAPGALPLVMVGLGLMNRRRRRVR